MSRQQAAADRAFQAALEQIERVRIAGAKAISFDNEACRALDTIPSSLRYIPGLTRIDFDNTQVSNLEPLRYLTDLRTLSITNTPVTDLLPLGQLTGLRGLSLNQTIVADLAPLRNLTGLHLLSLNESAVVDLSLLRGLTELRELSFSHTAVTDLAPLRGLTGLVTLAFVETDVADIDPLRSLTGLQRLYLAQTFVADIAPLVGMTDLRTLTLSQTTVADLAPLRGLIELRMLWLNQTAVADLRPICLLENLGEGPLDGLDFRDIPAIRTDPELARFAEIKDHQDRTRQTLAYLRSLPPWPEPYTPNPPVDGSSLKPLFEDPKPPELAQVRTAQAQIHKLLRHALVTRFTAQQLSELITAALHGVPATHGNELSPILQMMAEVAEVLGQLGHDPPDAKAIEREQTMRLRIAQLEAIIEKLTAALRDETEARIAAEAVAKKDGFLQSYTKSLGAAAGVGTIGLIAVGVPTAAVYFLGANHPLVQAFLTVVGRLPKT